MPALIDAALFILWNRPGRRKIKLVVCKNMTIPLSHILQEIQEVCNRILMVH